MDGLNNQPDLHDLLKMEDDSADDASKRTSPVCNARNALSNATTITTPAKVLMVGEPVLVKTETTESEDKDERTTAASETTTSAVETSGSSTEELADGICSPSPETAAAMESAIGDDDFSSASPKLGELSKLPVNFTSTNTKVLVKPQTSIMASIKTTQPLSIAGKKFTIATQPVQVLRKEGGGGPIVTKYIVKRTNSATAAAQKPQVVFAKSSLTSQSTVKAINPQSGGSIMLSPIKGGFKIPISPIKSPIKVSVIPPTNTKKGTRTQNKPYTIPIQTSVSQLQIRTQPSVPTVTIANTSSQVMNGLTTQVNKAFSPQHIIVQNRVVNTNSNPPQSNTQPQVLQLNVPNTGLQDSPGVKYQYVQLVNNPQQQTNLRSNQGQQITFTSMAQLNGGSLPLSQNTGTLAFIQPTIQKYQSVSTKPKTQPVKVTIPSQSSQQAKPQQRLIMPATSLQPIRPNLVNLAPGSILSGPGNVGYAMVPAKYVEQLTKQLSRQAVPTENATPSAQKQTASKIGSNGKLKKPCNCTKSQCLKLYCECFANGQFCDECNCINCSNNLEHEVERSKAVKQCLERNPAAFRPKIGRGKDDNRTHQKGCNCKRSGCLKNYCECYEARIPCTSKCKCIGCKNYEETNDRRSLMSLADAAAVRVQQQTAAKTKLASQIGDVKPAVKTTTSSGERLPYTFFTQEVIEATCTCLLAQAEEAEKTHRPMVVAESMILEEFGRCIMQIIQSAGKAKVNQ